ncbi:precorrin-6A reductase [Clostridium aminobutyricum]|uniref:precorrin-2 dehydrogenase n=1 Tax=Clostridium aminobutyricum TaxID=33953 RepID=A0A939D6E3_CLOAM|nr:precorrin-6A reductase [Clostridium aminobutyricum]MBN7771905.1 precorrin-6A reductase [Clostridium aminobutyricum]
MLKILVFAGTTEGRNLVEKLLDRGHTVHISVATDYGKEVLEESFCIPPGEERVTVHTGRLSIEQMQELIKRERYDVVVDATHPYATEVTENIQAACNHTEKRYLRLLRRSSNYLNKEDCVFVKSMQEAVRILNEVDGKALLTIGSKELQPFTQVKDFKERLFARVLPMEEVLKSCSEWGFTGKHLICMQGPFSYEMNKAMLNQLGCKYMVTKDSGKEGGLPEKYRAVQDAGAVLIVIGRPEEGQGFELEELLKVIEGTEGEEASLNRADWFPLFANIRDVNVVVVGAGKIAQRRIETLLKFSCNLKVIAREASEEVSNLINKIEIKEEAQDKRLNLVIKEFKEEDLWDAQIALAATNNRILNQQIGQLCRQRGILVNVADSKEECDFYFPGVVLKEELVIGITAGGKNHALAKKAGTFIRQSIGDL